MPREGDQSVHKLGIVSETGREQTSLKTRRPNLESPAFHWIWKLRTKPLPEECGLVIN